jgi:peptidoglycan/xylan/chitin deacetylase (PgdA/CDA1 family)
MTHNLMFHHFHFDKQKQIQGSWTDTQFEDLIAGLLRKGYDFILPSDANFKILADQDHKSILLTFDDALSSQISVAKKILDKYRIKGIFFIYTNIYYEQFSEIETRREFRNSYFSHIDEFYEAFFNKAKEKFLLDINKILKNFSASKYLSEYTFYSLNDRFYRYLRDFVLTKEQHSLCYDGLYATYATTKADLAKGIYMTKNDLLTLQTEGHSIGLHSHSHPFNIHQLSRIEAVNEYKKNMQCLKEIGIKNIDCMSHPSGNYNDEILKGLETIDGLLYGFRADHSLVHSKSRFLLPRVDCNDRAKMTELL